jgi:hypothetical protein
MESPIGLILRA